MENSSKNTIDYTIEQKTFCKFADIYKRIYLPKMIAILIVS